MSLEEQQEITDNSRKVGLSTIRQMRDKFHDQAKQADGLYLHYRPASGGLKEGVAKIMELLELPNLHSITTKRNAKGGIDIVQLHFKSTLEASKQEAYEGRPRVATKFKYRNI